MPGARPRKKAALVEGASLATGQRRLGPGGGGGLFLGANCFVLLCLFLGVFFFFGGGGGNCGLFVFVSLGRGGPPTAIGGAFKPKKVTQFIRPYEFARDAPPLTALVQDLAQARNTGEHLFLSGFIWAQPHLAQNLCQFWAPTSGLSCDRTWRFPWTRVAIHSIEHAWPQLSILNQVSPIFSHKHPGSV